MSLLLSRPDQLMTAYSKHYPAQEYGYELSYNALYMDKTKLGWGSFYTKDERKAPMLVTDPKVEMHFNLKGRSSISCETHGVDLMVRTNETSIFYQNRLNGEYTMYAGEATEFFEVELEVPVFESLIPQESPFLHQFYDKMQASVYHWPGYALNITPQMHQIIHDMTYTTYTGQMKRLYLEAKIIELFLLQASAFDAHLLQPQTLHPQDVERLHFAREYLHTHYHHTCSILSLSLISGLNQKKLKQGFKSLFGHTVFGYLSHVRMEKAKQLLLDEKMTVGEVSELVGYQYPQHFAVAFRRKYGILSGSLKN